MKGELSRRAALAGLLSSVGAGVLAQTDLAGLRPRPRPQKAALNQIRPVARPSLKSLIANAGISGEISVLAVDMATGETIESYYPNAVLPPASVAKAVTSLYAIETLGADFRFVTRVLATAPLINGRVDGDLILAGGGDPTLQTDDLAALAERLKASGLREVSGRFLVYDAALQYLHELDDTQADHLGYNPSISGLNLNFNRVHFEWRRSGANYTIAMDARSEKYRPEVSVAKMKVVERDEPVYAYVNGAHADHWTVAKGALGKEGSRWLPVRRPGLYAAEVFATFARAHGIVLPKAGEIEVLPEARLMAAVESKPLADIARGMLRYSTNLTAEVLGLTTSVARAGRARGLRTSALEMARWLERRVPGNVHFADHSGLSDQSRISAKQMAALLQSDQAQSVLPSIFKPFNYLDDRGGRLPNQPAQILAKTGTLNFVTTLAGYINNPNGRKISFAIFAADLPARDFGKKSGEETPKGAAAYNRRVRKLQQSILRHLAKL